MQMQDRETGDRFEVTDVSRVWVSYAGSAGEGSVRADNLHYEFELVGEAKPARSPRPH